MAENRIMNYVPYGLGFDILQGTIVVHVTYPQKWKVVEIDKGSPIKTFFEQQTGRQYYWADDNMDLNLILDEIDETINLNKDLQARFDLLKEKIDELRQLFIEKELEELKTMEFTFKKKKKPVNVKKKSDVVEKEEPTTVQTAEEVLGTQQLSEDAIEDDSIIESDIDKKIAAAMKKNKRKTGE